MVICIKCRQPLVAAVLKDIGWSGVGCRKCGRLHGRDLHSPTIEDGYNKHISKRGYESFAYERDFRAREFATYLKSAKPVFNDAR